MNCKSCVFWEAPDSELTSNGFGTCHVRSIGAELPWPKRGPSDWCGEFKGRFGVTAEK